MMAGEDLEVGEVVTLGLAEEGVGVAIDEHNQDLVTEEMKAAVDDARQKIIDGEIKVVSYYENDSRSALDFEPDLSTPTRSRADHRRGP